MLARAQRRTNEAATLAKRWAAKEACSKALGTGLAMGIAWRDMAVSNLASGQPTMRLSGWAAERLAAFLANDPVPVVLDPVMIAKSGDVLASQASIAALVRDLLPLPRGARVRVRVPATAIRVLAE